MANCYLDHYAMLRSPAGLETASLLGNSMRLSSSVSAAATSLPVTPVTTVALNQYDRVTVFDGPSSEVVIVASTAAVGASTATLSSPGFAYAHAAGTPCCSDGVMGSLADQLMAASIDLENICNQSLFQATVTGEILPLPSMQASFTVENALLLRPKRYPVTAISAIVLYAQQGSPLTLDATQAFIDVNAQTVAVPVVNATANTQVIFPALPMNRSALAWATITYTAGFTASAMPLEVTDAAVLLASDILSRRQNPTGADSLVLGKKNLIAVTRGDFSGESLNRKMARQKLRRYTRKVV